MVSICNPVHLFLFDIGCSYSQFGAIICHNLLSTVIIIMQWKLNKKSLTTILQVRKQHESKQKLKIIIDILLEI